MCELKSRGTNGFRHLTKHHTIPHTGRKPRQRPAHIARRAAALVPKQGPTPGIAQCPEFQGFFGIFPSNISYNDYIWGKNRDPSIKAWWIVQGCDFIVFSCANLRKNYNAKSLADPGTLPPILIQWWDAMKCDLNTNNSTDLMPGATVLPWNKTQPIQVYADYRQINILRAQLPWRGGATAAGDPEASWIKENEVILIAGGLGLLYISGMSLWGRHLKLKDAGPKKGGGDKKGGGGEKKPEGEKKDGGGGGGRGAGGESGGAPKEMTMRDRDTDSRPLDRRDSSRSRPLDRQNSYRDPMSADPRMPSSRRGAPGGFMTPVTDSFPNFPGSPFGRGPAGGRRVVPPAGGMPRRGAGGRDRDYDDLDPEYDVRDPDDDMTPMMDIRGPMSGRAQGGGSRRVGGRGFEDEPGVEYGLSRSGSGGRGGRR
ncbi:hypothetical protein HDU93_001590 [Gonapodya sp. JEL0774]|nr:hypothetical protein HDU93_001590 [Gonapodya sp. JEL0774]